MTAKTFPHAEDSTRAQRVTLPALRQVQVSRVIDLVRRVGQAPDDLSPSGPPKRPT